MKKIILNHKSYFNITEIKSYIKEISQIKSKTIEMIIFPCIPYLSLFENCNHLIGSQTFYSKFYGDYTGEISLECLKDMNINYVMLNHPERYAMGVESKELVKEKLINSIKCDVNIILMVGESEYSKEPFKEVKKQLNYLFKDLSSKEINNISILYEPIIEIEEVEKINMIRKMVVNIKEYFIDKFKYDIDVYYGKGVRLNNVKSILEVCDGVGIGKKSTNIKFIESLVDKISNNSTK